MASFVQPDPVPFRLVSLDDYLPLVGEETVERIAGKARRLRDLHVVNVNSTYHGGGVAELLSSLTLLVNACGIRTGWRVIQGRPDFFSITKKFHNALQGAEINFTELERSIYEEVVFENAQRMHFDHDVVIVHDPQPLPLVRHYRWKSPWIWRCHIDLSSPNREVWDCLRPFVERYDVAVLHLPEYAQRLRIPQRFILPAIDPFSAENREMGEEEIRERLEHYRIPTDLPLVVQISRFDRFEEPQGVIEAFRIARREIDATLVLVGNVATDDPEGQEVFASLCACRDERIVVLSVQDSALVDALQRSAAVVLQKSLREGFGLTVTEAMWKGAAVVGGNVGGIRHQIRDHDTRFPADTAERAADRIVRAVRDPDLWRRIGAAARESKCRDVIPTRPAEDRFDLPASLQASCRFAPGRS
jgi:trehalose synthase